MHRPHFGDKITLRDIQISPRKSREERDHVEIIAPIEIYRMGQLANFLFPHLTGMANVLIPASG